MGIRRRRRKLTTLMSRLEQRVKSVELRSTSLLTQDEINAAIEIGDITQGPASLVGSEAPGQFYQVQDAYLYPKRLTGLSEDRVEIYLEADLDAQKDEIIEVSGIHGALAFDLDVDGNFPVRHSDTPPWTSRQLPNNAGIKHDPDDDQLPGVSITNTYSIRPETLPPSNISGQTRLQTRRQISTYAIAGTSVTLVMNADHKFKAEDVVFVDIFEEDSRAYGADGLFRIASVTNNTIVYTLTAGVDTPVEAKAPASAISVYPVARKFYPIGSTWTDTSDNDTVYFWDGIRWVAWSTSNPAPTDGDPPAPPTNLQITSVLNIIDGNYSSATVDVTWVAPITTAAGKPLTDLAGYYLQWKKSTEASYGAPILFDPNDTSYQDNGRSYKWEAGETYNFQLWAIDSGLQKSTTIVRNHTLPAATTVPLTQLAPSTPIPYIHLGTVSITWNGLMTNGSGVPEGTQLLEFHRSTAGASFTVSADTLIATATAVRGTKFVFNDQVFGTTYYYRLRLRGLTPGSFSLASQAVAAQTGTLVDAQRIADIISSANIEPGTIVKGDNIIGLTITGNLIQGNVLHANVLEANSITALQIDTGSITAAVVASGLITTRTPVFDAAGKIVNYTGAGLVLSSEAGLTAKAADDTETFNIHPTTGLVTLGGIPPSNFLTTPALNTALTTALTNYVTGDTFSTALTSYAQLSDLGLYIRAQDASTTYLSINTAQQSFLSKSDAENTYISQLTAEGLFLKSTDAENTYVTTLSAGTLFLDKGTYLSPNSTTINGGQITTNSINVDRLVAGTLTGFTVNTRPNGTRVQLRSDDIEFYGSSGLSGSINGGVNLFINASAGGSLTSGGVSRISWSSSEISLNRNTSLTGSLGASGTVSSNGGFDATGTTIGASVSTKGGIQASGNITIGGTSNLNGTLNVASTAEFAGGIFRTQLATGGTTLASFNNSGALVRDSSSQRYKQDIETLQVPYEAILALQPKTFRRIEEVEESIEATRYPGFIAEDLAGTDLDIFVFYSLDENGNRQPEGVRYAELTAALVSAIKHQDTRLNALEARLAALEGN